MRCFDAGILIDFSQRNSICDQQKKVFEINLVMARKEKRHTSLWVSVLISYYFRSRCIDIWRVNNGMTNEREKLQNDGDHIVLHRKVLILHPRWVAFGVR